MTNERERFQEALHIMKIAIEELKTALEEEYLADPTFVSRNVENFNYGLSQATKVFGDVLLQRDVETIFHDRSEGVDPKG